MKSRKWFSLLGTLCLCGLFCAEPRQSDGQAVAKPAAIPANVDRSPMTVAISPDRHFCAATNHTSNSVALVDLKSGRVVAEHACGRGPCDVVWIDATTLLVSLLNDDAVLVLAVHRSADQPADSGRSPGAEQTVLKTVATIEVGDEPRGIALLPGEDDAAPRRAYVALSGIDRVAVVDLSQWNVIGRITVGGQPNAVAVSPNGKWLVTCCNVPGEVFVHETSTHKLISRRTVFDDGFNLGVPVILPDSSTCVFPSPINRTLPVSEDNIEKGWVIDNRLTKLPLPAGKYWQQKQLGLDTRGNAAGDPHAVALSPDGKWLVVTCGGSHELLILDYQQLKWPVADPGDFLPVELLETTEWFRHVELGGRPLGVKFIDNHTVIVANYLANTLQIVDVAAEKLVRTILLGGPAKPSLARRGEAIFFDADRSLDSWFSCHTCHADGHTSGQVFDTLNDGNYDTYKLTPSLRGVTKTAPWTWHGWQTSLSASLKKSLETTLGTKQPVTEQDVNALLAFLETLEHPTSPFRAAGGRLTAQTGRGKLLFEGKAGCVSCHQGAYFTSAETYKVGLESNRYFYPEFNPPSLRGLHARRRFLHDGRADSLLEVLTQHHQPQNLTGEQLTTDELLDLIAYLKSL